MGRMARLREGHPFCVLVQKKLLLFSPFPLLVSLSLALPSPGCKLNDTAPVQLPKEQPPN